MNEQQETKAETSKFVFTTKSENIQKMKYRFQ